MAEAHKRARRNPKCKTQYRVADWPEYEASLCRRGDISFWVDEAVIKAWTPPKTSKRGGQRRYSDLAIETAPTLRLLFHLPLRQTEGRRPTQQGELHGVHEAKLLVFCSVPIAPPRPMDYRLAPL